MWDSGTRMLSAIGEKRLGVTELARKTGIPRSTINAFILDGRDISSMRLAKLCSEVGVSIDWVMGLKKED